MPIDPHVVLQAVQSAATPGSRLPRLLIAGATGVLGNAVLRRLVGMRRASHTHVLAVLPIRPGLRHVSAHIVPAPLAGHDDDFGLWPLVHAELAIVMFDPPRLFYGRERALWTPRPAQLAPLGRWLQRCGIHTLAVVLPHDQGSLPASLRHGLAGVDEHALAALQVPRVLIVRTARKPGAIAEHHWLRRLARWMLGVTNYMVPRSEQPVRAQKIAELVDVALRELPAGTHVLAPETVWAASQGDSRHMRAVLHEATGNRTRPSASG